MAHFGRTPSPRARLGVVLSGLLLNYFGQGAFVLREPEADRYYVKAPRPTGIALR